MKVGTNAGPKLLPRTEANYWMRAAHREILLHMGLIQVQRYLTTIKTMMTRTEPTSLLFTLEILYLQSERYGERGNVLT